MTVTLTDTAPPSTAELLTGVLLGPEHRREHGFWQRLISTEPFRRPAGGTPEERLELAYDRLRILNLSLDSGARLASDPRALAALHAWLGPVDPALTTVAGIHYNLFLGSLLDHECAGRRDLSDYLTMRRIGTFLCTEVAHGNNAAAMETTATYDRERDGFVLHTPNPGAQKFMPNTSPAGGAKSGLVAARLVADGADHGVRLFLVQLTDETRALPGIRVRRLPARMGSPVDHCLTSFDQLFVERDALLGSADEGGVPGEFRTGPGDRRRRFLTSIGRVTPGRISMSACAAGSARATLAVAVRYGGHRMISGSRGAPPVPVNAHRTHHGPLASAMATVFAMSLLYRRAQERWEACTGEDGRTEAGRLVDVAKAWITWRAREVIVESRERCGAQALLENNGMTELVTGVEGAITAEGDNIALYAKAAADMLFAAEPGRDDVPGPAARPGDLADPRFLGGLLASVQDIWFARARTRALRAPDADALGRWNAASGPALRGVEAWAYRQAAEAYAEARAALPRGDARDRLAELERLFAVEWVSRNSGDLLAAGLLSGDQVEALPDAVEELVAAVAAHAPELADSFALPERLLADWPIAGPGYADAYDDPAGPWNAVPADAR
ncbi:MULTISPECIES: acyl-CoA dehydrogenase family protein [unclassified Streptomyces]|uniref:acyl-CoA dehydrogenase family protein n=1 Tax=unclassified Streptomyces TaxID=2593676 RepID=UPI0029BB19B1|nr:MULTISPECIES: acyl-CoA dehydrogenase [unclassified Streptomyces]MDX3428353.1 acyl-CoA dehydrogenase family protein [Streptomyces sp. ME01-18a]MDX3684618.1 acyl-CoA dehydrogenase family protein [Streptomyces sp. AK04-4c]